MAAVCLFYTHEKKVNTFYFINILLYGIELYIYIYIKRVYKAYIDQYLCTECH